MARVPAAPFTSWGRSARPRNPTSAVLTFRNEILGHIARDFREPFPNLIDPGRRPSVLEQVAQYYRLSVYAAIGPRNVAIHRVLLTDN